MADPSGDYIDVPCRGGTEVRRFQLPIQRRMCWKGIGPLALVLFCFTLTSSYEVYSWYNGDHSRLLEYCKTNFTSKRCAQSPPDVEWFLTILTAFFACALIYWAIQIHRASKVLGPHLVIDRNSFWCLQIDKPIAFSEIVKIDKYFGQLNPKKRSPIFLEIVVRTRPNMRFGRAYIWGKEMFAFCWSNTGFKDGRELLEAVACLFELYLKDQKPR
jgi:hypothetical protein